VIAINLPYRQANDCNIGGGLGVSALFGYSQDTLVKNQNGTWEAILSSSPTVVKANGADMSPREFEECLIDIYLFLLTRMLRVRD